MMVVLIGTIAHLSGFGSVGQTCNMWEMARRICCTCRHSEKSPSVDMTHHAQPFFLEQEESIDE
jgi:hypothetical protein